MLLPGLAAQGPPSRNECPGPGGHCSAAQEATCPPDPPQPRGFRSSATATPWVLFSIRPSVAAAQLLCGRSQSAETRDRPCHVVLGTLQGLPKSSLGLRDPLWPHPLLVPGLLPLPCWLHPSPGCPLSRPSATPGPLHWLYQGLPLLMLLHPRALSPFPLLPSLPLPAPPLPSRPHLFTRSLIRAAGVSPILLCNKYNMRL